MDKTLTEIVANGDFSALKLKLSSITNLSEFIDTPVDGGGATLLHLAANSSVEILLYLLENNADPGLLTEDGLTPLHIAAMWGRLELVRTLLQFGVDIEVYDNEGMLPVDYAQDEGHKECAQLLDSVNPCLYSDPDPNNKHELSCAESFVAMFETFTLNNSAVSECNHSDFSEDTLQVTQDKLYQTAFCSPVLNTSNEVENITLHNSLSSASQVKFNTNPECSSVNSHNESLECSFAREIQTVIPNEIRELTNSQLHDRLVTLGEQPGPINEFTRQAYLVYLSKYQSGIIQTINTVAKGKQGFRYELALVLGGVSPVPDLEHIDEEIVREFANTHASTCRARAITQAPSSRSPVRDNFNYLLLDPQKLSKELVDDLSEFKSFVNSIFYIGKGKNARPVQHLKDAKTALTNKRVKLSSKLEHITSIWECGKGVVSLPVYHNTHEGEAFTRECCMIDAIGLDNLTNKVKGHPHGSARYWPLTKRRQYGVYLLYKAFKVFRLTKPPQIYQHDL